MTALFRSTNGTAICLIRIFSVCFPFILITMKRKILLRGCKILGCLLDGYNVLDSTNCDEAHCIIMESNATSFIDSAS